MHGFHLTHMEDWWQDPDFHFCHKTGYKYWKGPVKYTQRFNRKFTGIEPKAAALPSVKCTHCKTNLSKSATDIFKCIILRCKCRTRITHVDCGETILKKMPKCSFCGLKIVHDQMKKALVEIKL